MQNPVAVITSLENAPGIILPLVREVPPAILKRRPRPGKWSAHEHACHLTVAQKIFGPRLDSMLQQSHPRIAAYNPDQQETEDHLLRLDLEDSLVQFAEDRRQLVERLRNLRPEEWERTAEHPEYSQYSVFIMFRHLALHDLFHAYRIEELLLKKDWD